MTTVVHMQFWCSVWVILFILWPSLVLRVVLMIVVVLSAYPPLIFSG